ncbi:MAG: hypothetical protein JWN52_6609 [Actinomycetia bacterium]|nr:hypothetical protein [Actinomycetes bacterium]
MSKHETALKFAVLKILRDRLKAAKEVADGEIVGTWKVKDRNAAVLPDGTEIGSVTLAKGRTTATLSDDEAYFEWVLENHPDEIEQVKVTRVKPGFTERLLNFARQTGDCVNPATGQPVPGISVGQGEPYALPNLAKDADDLITRAWQDGSLAALVATLVQPAVEGGE